MYSCSLNVSTCVDVPCKNIAKFSGISSLCMLLVCSYMIVGRLFLVPSLYPPQHSGGGYTGVAMAVRTSIRLSICVSIYPWTQFCPELLSYSFARTALKFIHNICVHVKLCMCNFHDHTLIGCGIIFP